MGFFRRLFNGTKRMEGFQGPDPSLTSHPDKADLAETALKTSTEYKFDNISVASYESGDEVSQEQDDTIWDDAVSTNTEMLYEGLELTTSEIRTLTLHPARNKKDDIHCTLAKAKFKTKPLIEDEPIYEALSYTWGDAREKRIIHVNRHPVPVTANLYVALEYLRKADEPRVLWVDALCIDQQNLVEKTHQVSIMKNIYTGASQVLVWLGESDKDLRKAMAFFKQLEVTKSHFPAKEDIAPFVPGLGKFFKKPWWSRLWVVQEVVAAHPLKDPLLGCGRIWIPWNVVRRAMFSLGPREWNGEGFLQNPAAISSFSMFLTIGSGYSYDKHHRTRTLGDLLRVTCDRETTQQHDKVFALLGLTTDEVLDDVKVDYTYPFSVTYQKAMVHVLRSESNMNFLVQAMNYRASRDVPSWCVDFSQPNWNRYSDACRWFNEPWRQEGAQESNGASGKQLKATILHDPRQGTIRVSGAVVGCIKHFHNSGCDSNCVTKINKARRIEKPMRDLSKVEQRKVPEETCLVTDTGYRGRAATAVNAVMEGDLLCIIYGCRLPVILRSLGQAHKMVAFSYVTGLMDGEYFGGTRRQTRRFTLR
ncbi:MAG: hypothetical protein Q9166_004782 [cf. Caloplaca sp. 2 TL-2023]